MTLLTHFHSFDCYSYSAAYAGGGLSEECDISSATQACQDYNQKMEELEQLIGKTVLKKTTEDLNVEPVALSGSSKKQSSTNSPALQAALVEAQQVTADHGITSSQARLAWETVEEIAASPLDVKENEECLVDAAQAACQALGELQRVLEL